MASNITTFQGRRCTKVRRSAGAAPSSSVATAAAPKGAASSSTPSVLRSSAAGGASSASVKPDVSTSTAMAGAAAPPTPIPPPPPPESETAALTAPTSVVRSMVSSTATPTLGGATGVTPKPPPTPIPPPPPAQSADNTPVQTSMKVMEPTPAPNSPATSAPVASTQAPPQAGSPAITPAPQAPDPQSPAASQVLPAPNEGGPQSAQPPVSSRRGGNPQNTVPAAAPVPGQSNAPNPGSAQPGQPANPAQPNGGGNGGGNVGSSGSGSGSGGGNGAGTNGGEAPNAPIVQPGVKGTAPLAPFPALVTGIPPSRPSVVITTGKNGSPTTFTTTPPPSLKGQLPFSTGVDPAKVPHADGSTVNHQPGDTHSQHEGKKLDVGTIGGAVAGALGVIIIVALVWFCGRRAAKRRKRGSVTPLLNRDSGLRTKTSISEKIGYFLKRNESGDDGPREGQRATTPALERGMRESTQDPLRVRSSRASSAPATSFRERAMATLVGKRAVISNDEVTQEQSEPPRLPTPTPMSDHRKSASVSSFIQSWSATSDENNPFRDPETRGPLGLVNADLSRQNTIRQPVSVVTPGITSSPLRLENPFASPPATPSSPIPVDGLPTRPRHKRSFSQNRIDPFMDPVHEVPRGQTPDAYSQREDLTAVRRTRTRSISAAQLARGGSQTSPIISSLRHQPSASSTIDSGFVSADSPPIGTTSDRRWNEISTSPRPDASTTRTFDPLSTVISRSSGKVSPSLGMASPSQRSERSSIMSFDFGPDLLLGASPGPTRPSTSMYLSFNDDKRMSHISDPFDLDRPEVLGFMGRNWGRGSRDASLSRSGSGGSSRSKKSVGKAAEAKSNNNNNNGTNWYMTSTTPSDSR